MNKTLLFGNGVNLLSENALDWIQLLEELKKSKKFDNGHLPNTMIYEKVLLDRVLNGKNASNILEKSIKEEIAKKMSKMESNPFYNKLFQLYFDNYLTTNYDYSFINGITSQKISTKNNSAEEIYSIRRNTSINIQEKEVCKIWNIHGEINKSPSIMLGLDHYCGTIGKLDGYLKGTYEFTQNKKKIRVQSILNKLREKKFDQYSWIELFFNSDIHIIGLSLDFSETDLWWILNKRARMMTGKNKKLIKNKIYFYTDHLVSEDKEKLLLAFNVEVIKDRVIGNDWLEHYYRLLTIIKEK